LPPGQREQKSCSDGTYDQPCLTGGKEWNDHYLYYFHFK
jgi:hypothetical protein